jgi:hypothetical protein
MKMDWMMRSRDFSSIYVNSYVRMFFPVVQVPSPCIAPVSSDILPTEFSLDSSALVRPDDDTSGVALSLLLFPTCQWRTAR